MIPLWIWPALCIVLLEVVVWFEIRESKRRIENFRAIEAERMARENSKPLGNADRLW